jgi:hypothetical protein
MCVKYVCVSELYSAPRLSFSIALRLNSLLSWQLEGGQRSYTQFQNVGIKNKLNAGTLQMAQLTPPSWRVGASCDSRSTLRRLRACSFAFFLLLHKTPIKTCSKPFFFFSSTHFLQKFWSRSKPPPVSFVISRSLTIDLIVAALTVQVHIIPGLNSGILTLPRLVSLSITF